jgi:hypothetical protein
MISFSPMWEELGIEPTLDAKAIRRAYAERLKSIDADADIDAFQRLRRAYEMALASAMHNQARPADGTRQAEPPIGKARQPIRLSIRAEPRDVSTSHSDALAGD